MSEQALTLEIIEKEIETLTKQLEEKKAILSTLEKGIKQCIDDANAVSGALQQCNKMKELLSKPITIQAEKVEAQATPDKAQ